MTAPNAPVDASALFSDYVIRNAAYALTQVQRARQLSAQQRSVALQALQFALARNEAWPQSRDLLLALAPHMERAGFRGVWQSFLERGIAGSQGQHDIRAEMMLRYHLGMLMQSTARSDDAIRQYEAALVLARDVDEPSWLVRLNNRLGYSLRRQRRWPEAEAAIIRAQALMTPQDDEEQGYACLVLGSIHLDRREWLEARQFFRCSLKRWHAGVGERKIAWAHSNLGMIAWRLGRMDEGEQHFRSALTILQSLDDPESLAVTSLNLGGLLSDTDRADQALAHLRRAEFIFRTMQNRWRLAMTATNLGRAYYELERWDEAIDAFDRSVVLWTSLHRPVRRLNASVGLAAAFVQQGDVQQAERLIANWQETVAQLPQPGDQTLLRDSFLFVEKMIAEVSRGDG